MVFRDCLDPLLPCCRPPRCTPRCAPACRTHTCPSAWAAGCATDGSWQVSFFQYYADKTSRLLTVAAMHGRACQLRWYLSYPTPSPAPPFDAYTHPLTPLDTTYYAQPFIL